VKTGVQIVYNHSKALDSGFRRNDEKNSRTFCEAINMNQPIIMQMPETKSLQRSIYTRENYGIRLVGRQDKIGKHFGVWRDKAIL